MANNYGGIYRGVVVTGNDHTPLNRIRLSVPMLTGTATMWALPCHAEPDKPLPRPLAGQGVWVMFENGDLSYPVVVGFYGTVRTPHGKD